MVSEIIINEIIKNFKCDKNIDCPLINQLKLYINSQTEGIKNE